MVNWKVQSAKFGVAAVTFICIAGIAFADLVTNYETAISLVYIVPIYLAAWFSWVWASILIALLGGISDTILTTLAHRPYHTVTLVNSVIQSVFFIIFTGVLLALKKAHRRLEAFSITDPLTGAYNRTYLNDRLPQEIRRARKYARSLSLIMSDIDNFKRINDSYSHPAGDRVLRTFVQSVRAVIRVDCDWIARFGGDEFLIVLPETSPAGGGAAAERFARIVSEKAVIFGAESIQVSASFGVTGFNLVPPQQDISADALIALADKALYQAKREQRGGVRVQAWTQPALVNV